MNWTHRLNGHTGTMKRKRKQNILAQMSLKLSPKHTLGQTERVPNMQMPVAVRKGKGDNELFLVRVGMVGLEDAVFFPLGLDGDFVGAQGIAFGGSFESWCWCCFLYGEVGHFCRGWCGCWCHCCNVCWLLLDAWCGLYFKSQSLVNVNVNVRLGTVE